MDLSNENIIHIKKDGIEYIQFRKLLEYEDVITHAYTLGTNINFRTATVYKKDLPEEEYNTAIDNYKKICSSIGSNYIKIVKSNQAHTDNVEIVRNKVNKDKPDINLRRDYYSDGLITNKQGIILTTTNADCILMLFFDPVKKVIANVHSGWKGTIKKISEIAVEKMVKEYSSNPRDIICCISPSIRKCHFEVDEDVKKLFYERFKKLEGINKSIVYNEQKNKWNIDTVMINKAILENKGLMPENIIDSGICSVCNSKLVHSYRVEKEGYGLSTALIELKEI